MIKHIVMFRLDCEDDEKAFRASEFKAALEALPARIEGLESIEVGINNGPAPDNWDIVLTAVCPDYGSLATYAAHPDHVACVAIIKPVIAARACVDYTV